MTLRLPVDLARRPADEGMPLHLRIAEALGWKDIRLTGGILLPGASQHSGYPPGTYGIVGQPEEGRRQVPLCDSWVVVGPLVHQITRLVGEMDVRYSADNVPARRYGAGVYIGTERRIEYAPTLQEAVCELWLALHAEGRLSG